MYGGYKIIRGPESIQGSDEWLRFREGKVGASDIASIMSASPWETLLEAWERIVFNVSRPKTYAMQRGSDLEDGARKVLNFMTGRDYKPIVIQSLLYPDVIASLDGYWVSPKGKIHIAEIKCPGRRAHSMAVKGDIPMHYEFQVAQQLLLSEADHAVYFSWDGSDYEGAIIEYPRDKKLEESIFKKVLSFLDSMTDFKPPIPGKKDWIECNDDDLIVKSYRYKQLDSLIEELTLEKTEIRNELIKSSKHNRFIVGDLKIHKVTRKGAIDYIKYAQDVGSENIEKYRKKPNESWRIYE